LIVYQDVIVLAGLFIANEKRPFAAVFPRNGVVYEKILFFEISLKTRYFTRVRGGR
jgi:hypothetical protein